MIAPIIALALAASGPGCTEPLCNAEEIRPFLEKLNGARPAARGRKPLHILQIGDSHTAGDAITGAWRDLIQARHGYGGRGVLAGGRPYQGYLTRGVTVTMSPGWQVNAIFGAGSASPRPPIGVAGFSLTAVKDGATMALVADPEQRFDRFVLCAISRPDAGTLTIRIGTRTETMRLDSPTTRPECRTISLDVPAGDINVTAEGGQATITSWATFNDAGGVALSNVGVVGSQLVHFSRNDDAVLAEEMRAYRPDLIILAYGTNEGFAPRFSPFEYEVVLRTQIGRVRRIAGNVPILLLGAPDASSRRPEMLSNAPGPTPAGCAEPIGRAPAPAPAQAPSQTLADIMAGVQRDTGTQTVAEPAAPPPAAQPQAAFQGQSQQWGVTARPLFPPAGLKAVRDVQRRIAAQLGVAFWDWELRMGGRCSAVRWVKGDPPLMRGDYVHFNSAGGREIGGRLNADLERAAAALRDAR